MQAESAAIAQQELAKSVLCDETSPIIKLMATIFLEYNHEVYPSPAHQGLFSLLLQRTKTQLGLPQVCFHYFDDEGDRITVNSQFDFQEALKYAEVKGELKLIVLAAESAQVFIQDLPMTESQVFSEDGSIRKSPPVTSLIMSEALPEPSHPSASTSTAPVQVLDKAIPCIPISQQDQSSSMDRSDNATSMDQHAVSCETAPIGTQDSTSDARPLADVQAQMIGRDLPVSVGLGTVPVESISELSGPEARVCMSSDTQPIEIRESGVQCEEVKLAAVDLPFDPSIIKSLIQDEIRTLFPPRHSLLRSQIARNVVHLGTSCSLCTASPIKGARFKCTTCADFNLCEDCEDGNEHEHVLLKLRLPEDSGLAGREEKKDNPLLDVRAIKHQSEKRVHFGLEEQEVEAAYNKHIPSIMEMGFSRESAIRALTDARGNVERAIESLLAS